MAKGRRRGSSEVKRKEGEKEGMNRVLSGVI